MTYALGVARPKQNFGPRRDPEKQAFAIVAYVPEYRVGGLDFDFVGERATDLILFSAEPTTSGGLKFYFGHDDLKRAYSLREDHGVRLLLCIGGGGRSAHFAQVARDPHLREAFASTLLETMKKYKLQGVDFDWEQPVNQEEAALYSQLLVLASDLLQPKNYMVTVVVHPWQTYLSPQAKKRVDRVHVMSYDHQGKHATYKDAKGDVMAMLKSGFPPHKITLGIPGYGRSLKNSGDVRTYEEIVRDYAPDAADDTAGPAEYFFNGQKTLEKKTQYALKKGLAGVMLWEAGQDTKDDETSLLSTIKRAVEASGEVVRKFSAKEEVGESTGGRRRRRLAVDEL